MEECISGRDCLPHAPAQVTFQDKHTGLWYTRNATNKVHNFVKHRIICT